MSLSPFANAVEISRALAAREVSAFELTQAAIARIEALDGPINAICVKTYDRARASAKAADEKLGRGERAPLLGVPMTVKESFNMAGTPTTWGLPDARDFRAETDALAVERAERAGAVVLGKTNVPLNLGDWQSYNDIYGVDQQPLRSRAHAGRVVGRLGGGAGGGFRRALAWLRHRRLPTRAGAFLRRLRPQADLRPVSLARSLAAGRAAFAGKRRPRRDRPDGAQRFRSRSVARRHRRPRRTRHGRRLPVGAASGAGRRLLGLSRARARQPSARGDGGLRLRCDRDAGRTVGGGGRESLAAQRYPARPGGERSALCPPALGDARRLLARRDFTPKWRSWPRICPTTPAASGPSRCGAQRSASGNGRAPTSGASACVRNGGRCSRSSTP